MKEQKLLQDRLELYYYILKFYTLTKKHDRFELNNKLLIPFDELNKHLVNLNKLGLLDINYYDKTINTSQKGKEFLEKFDFLTKLVGYVNSKFY